MNAIGGAKHIAHRALGITCTLESVGKRFIGQYLIEGIDFIFIFWICTLQYARRYLKTNKTHIRMHKLGLFEVICKILEVIGIVRGFFGASNSFFGFPN